MIPTSMRAVLLVGHGGYDKLEYVTDAPVPQPAADEVLVRVGASAINNTDINTRTVRLSQAARPGDTAASLHCRCEREPPARGCGPA